jgi:hypothetical protein
MIYFFTRQGSFIQCEIYPGQPNLLSVIDPDGLAVTERYASAEDLLARWRELRQGLQADGWSGPIGRDSRI